MSTTNPTRPTEGGSNGAPRGLGALLRGAADGELSAPQQAELDRHLAAHPEDSARIDFERELRTACARVMGNSEGCRAPASLRTRIEANLAAGAAKEPETVIARIHEGGRVEVHARRWRRTAGLIATAAVLPLAVAAWLIVGNRTGLEGAAQASIVPLDFLSRAHSGTINRVQPMSIGDVAEKVRQIVGKPLRIDDFVEKAGLTFVGLGACRTPDGSKAAQLVFSRRARGQAGNETGEAADVKLSLFVQNDYGKHRITEGLTWDGRGPDTATNSGPLIRAWLHDGLVNYVVTDCPDTCDLARQGLNGPDADAPLCGG